MGDRYLTDLAAVCRGTGLAVVEVDGWQSRARGSGGYNPGCPDHVMIHHTASPPSADGWDDVNYCTFGDEDAPLCNLYLDRAGTVYVCAAGATNTNGSGQDPCGVCPDDSMNSHAVGIEAGNDGTGERWPDTQLDAFLTVCSALCAHYAIPVSRVHGHAEWAPSRKVDPAGPARYATGAATWDLDAFRADLTAGPPLLPDTDGDDELNQDQANELHAAYLNSDWTWAKVQEIDAVIDGYLWPYVQTIEARCAAMQNAMIAAGIPVPMTATSAPPPRPE
jgi:hypothetical protein